VDKKPGKDYAMRSYDKSREGIAGHVVLWIALLVMCLSVYAARSEEGSETAREAIRLASDPALSPDGSTLAFVWRGDIWTVTVTGGAARQLTQSPARDRDPRFSPDGKEIAFTSDRDAGWQVYVMPVQGGTPEQITFHTSGHSLQGWFPDGGSLLVEASRDHFWGRAGRFFRIRRHERAAEQLLFDAYGSNGSLSSDGKRLLFTREGISWWRKGYYGSSASQIWMYDFETGDFTKILDHERGCRWPLWKSDGSGFYYVGAKSGSFNLWEYNLGSGAGQQLTHFEDDSVVFPCISRDGSTIVFRHLFDLYRYHPTANAVPERMGKIPHTPGRIEIWNAGDTITPRVERRTSERANQVTFSEDGLEVAFIAGGDLWVMDTELKEPRQITTTVEEERDPVFSPKGDFILFVSDQDGQTDIWKAKRADEEKYWWQNEEFKLERVTQDGEVESRLRFSPEGSRVAFVKGAGDLWTMDLEGKDAKKVLSSWNAPDYDWSPDGKWLAYTISDNDYNRDIWVIPADGSAEPFNLSRHPDNEYDPVWSPDGKLIAFTGRRVDTEVDMYFVWLRKEDDEKSKRERTMEKALEKMKKVRKEKKEKKAEEEPAAGEKQEEEKPTEDEKEEKKEPPEVIIDFEDIHERIRRVSIPNTSERGLFWSHDSKKLAFTATVDGKRGTYTIEIPDELKPKLLSTKTGSQARWIKQDNQIVWLSDGVPGSLSAKGEAKEYKFKADQEVDMEARNAAAFDLAWRTMRDHYYDERLGNRNWDAIRRKYVEMATKAVDGDTFATVVNLMLGELNGSHLGFYAIGTDRSSKDQWSITTVHLGVRFEPDYKGPGLKVKDVLPKGPAEHVKSRIEPGEVIMSINGVTVDPAMDLTTVLNGRLDQDIHLSVRNGEGEDREVTLRPISYGAARSVLYEKWIRDNRSMVEEASEGTLGYLHVRGMNWPSFLKFERELYSAGVGRDGLVIDVRNNGGGFTTDHLLTVLTQPEHAITVGRGGGPGYPQDRSVYATWKKPIVVLCNQNSFSNAEIFSHAIKTLKRGQLVGVPTAGGVISTGGRQIMDVGYIRIPGRGWFVLTDGEDMELNGAVPDHILWPEPGEMPRGKDVQLEKAIEVLLADVKKWKERPMPTLRKASERG
jgi:tricorn protease